MTDTTTLNLTAGLDRALAWHEGGSVRYLVADLSAAGETAQREVPALNLALAIDISGSMAGDKIDAARRAALAVVEALTARDRLSLVAFDNKAELLLDARPMDEAGRAAAASAIRGLTDRGGTNLFDGWLMAAERVATAMAVDPAASHRVLLLSDGHANDGLTDRGEIAGHVGALLERGVLTSALGIGDGYDEQLLGAIAEAGRRNRSPVPDRPFRRAVAQEDNAAGIERALRKLWRYRLPVPQQVIHAFGPGDGVRPTIGRQRRVHDAERGHAAPEQCDADRRAAMTGQEGAGPVIRIDDPAIGAAWPGIRPRLLAQPAGGQKGEQAIAEADFDLLVDLGMAALATRPARPRELGSQQASCRLGRGNHGGQEGTEVGRLSDDTRHAHRPGGRLKRSEMEARGAARRSSS
jgi:Mg-chelatase subunit ChlD